MYGIALDYKELIESLYDAGVAPSVELTVENTRTWADIHIKARTHFRGLDYTVIITLQTDVLLREHGYDYIMSTAHGIATALGLAVFRRGG
jgi:hypothetical protein